jgi:hypothetical protein
MPDVALLGDKNFLYEKLVQSAGAECLFLNPAILGSPFLPRFKMLVIPTGFANSQYSRALPGLRSAKSWIEGFVKKGGVLVVFGPLVLMHNYDWLPLPLEYVGEYCEAEELVSCRQDNSCICSGPGDCDGYLAPGEGFKTIMKDTQNRPVMVAGACGDGLIVATSIHEFPSPEFIHWALKRSKI